MHESHSKFATRKLFKGYHKEPIRDKNQLPFEDKSKVQSFHGEWFWHALIVHISISVSTIASVCVRRQAHLLQTIINTNQMFPPFFLIIKGTLTKKSRFFLCFAQLHNYYSIFTVCAALSQQFINGAPWTKPLRRSLRYYKAHGNLVKYSKNYG